MPSSWLILTTRWDLSSVAAALNVGISVLSTIGLWAFSRFWWQRFSGRILDEENGVPLSRLLLVSGPGEGWDVMKTLGRQLFAKENWPLLTQIFVVMCITITSALAGPIAKGSLKRGSTRMETNRQVFQATKGDGFYGSIMKANVLWNQTGSDLDIANFPLDQLLDKLPMSTKVPWVYVAEEWDPTWKMDCNYTNGVRLENVEANGDDFLAYPIDAYPAIKATYDPAWLNASEYRATAGFTYIADWNARIQFKHVLFFVLVQSNPEAPGRKDHNNETLNLSLSTFYARDIQIKHDGDTSASWEGISWRPVGTARDVTYSRAECVISRKPTVPDEDRIPWPWTNDTLSIIAGYIPYFDSSFTPPASKNQTVVPPTGQDLVRFYQIYMATMGIFFSDPSPGVVSAMVDTVELSIAFLVVALVLVLLTVWVTVRYRLFVRRHRISIEEICVPDGKVDWIVHAAKISEHEPRPEGFAGQKKRRQDRQYLQSAAFGRVPSPDPTCTQTKLQCPKFARVRSSRVLVVEVSPDRRSSSTLYPRPPQPNSNRNSDDDDGTAGSGWSSPSAGPHVTRNTGDLGPNDSTHAETSRETSPISLVNNSTLLSVHRERGRQVDGPEMNQVSPHDAEKLRMEVQRRETV